MKKIILCILISSICVYAGFLEDGISAYSQGEYKEATLNYEKSCNEDNAEGCFKLGYMYENKQKVKQDFQKAFELYDKACSLGNARGCYKMGLCFDKGGIIKVEQDYLKAESYYKKSCEYGFPLACYNLGGIYQYSFNPKQNKENMMKMFTKACDDGIMLGCYKLGNIYEGKQKDKAIEWYKKGCDKEDSQSCFRLVDIMIKQIAAIDSKDFEKVYKQYDEECKAGYMTQCYRLAILYSTGRGVKQSYSKARQIYQGACEMGDNASCIEYMMLTESGF